ncbi:MAG TPA: DUF3857 domain-containing protein [Allosphingosinicella sp.]|jgi:tetratricopeptide (TPR) repeat protein
MRLIATACLIASAAVPLAAAAAQDAAATAPAGQAAPSVAPAPAWVDRIPIPAADPAFKDKPLQPLLATSQSRYLKDGTREYYVEFATRLQTPEGLAALGSITLPWQPDRSELIVHKIDFIRDGKTVDALAGKQFTVLRRENNLESATLDGVLTAVLQPEGLAVGDVVDMAWTVRMKPGTLALRAENFLLLPQGFPVGHLRFREIWEDGVPLHWRADEALGKPRPSKSRWGSEVVVDLTGAKSQEAPANVPNRFKITPLLETSAYADWSDLAAVLAAPFAAARQLGPSSPLKAEIERIAAASPDPKKRTMAALRLVQDKIRYFALSIGDGNYVPATADQTWSRKFGDCKGKTVTLLALLSGLGIDAEPVLVSTAFGDGLDQRLPQLRLFDHVLVRAKIDGRSYFLDGTRLGDRDFEALASSPWGFGLPIRAAGAVLERLPRLPAPQPLSDMEITWDASKGFDARVPISGKVVYRGDMAAGIRVALAQAGKDALKDGFERMIGPMPPAEDLTQYDVTADDEAGTATVAFAGTARMDWSKAPGTNVVRYHFNDDTISWTPDFKRPDGPFKNAPFAYGFPVYLASSETVILPRGGQGFTIEGHDLDRTLAGVRVTRKLSLEGGRAVARSIFQRLQPELPAPDALAATKALAEVNANRAWVRSPPGYKPSDAERAAALAVAPRTAEDYVDRGFRLMQDGRRKEALDDFAKAAEMSPQWSRPHSDSAIVLLTQRKYDLAKAELDKAASLQEDDAVTWRGYGLLHLAQERPSEAAEAFTRSLVLENDDIYTLSMRAVANEQLGRFAEAAADLQQALRAEPANAGLLAEVTRLESWRGHEPEASAAADRLIAAAPDEPESFLTKARLLRRAGRSEEAAKLFAAALTAADKAILAAANEDAKRSRRIQRADILAESGQAATAVRDISLLLKQRPDSVGLLNDRCWTRGISNLELEAALKDCDQALGYDAENAAVTDSRAFVELRLGRLDAAIADFDKALGWAPLQAASWYGRGLAKLRKGDKDGGEKDLARARRLAYDIDERYQRYGMTAPAAAAPATPAAGAQPR